MVFKIFFLKSKLIAYWGLLLSLLFICFYFNKNILLKYHIVLYFVFIFSGFTSLFLRFKFKTFTYLYFFLLVSSFWFTLFFFINFLPLQILYIYTQIEVKIILFEFII